MIFNEQPKTQPISRLQVYEAFKRVKANKGSAGVDGITIEQVEGNIRKYLYPYGTECQAAVISLNLYDKY
jgi:retron-type reverse transcriptase